MKLTCVTAVFNAIKAGNRERLIRCVESIAKIKTEHEHLIYDGASTDGTVELLRELESKTQGLKVVSEPDTGIYNALNKGLRRAKGDWLLVLGCDDYIHDPKTLDDILGGDLRGCDVIVTPVKRRLETGCEVWFSDLRELGDIFCQACVCHQGELIRTELARRIGGFDEQYKIAADSDMFFKAHIMSARFKYIFKSFAYFEYGGVAMSDEERALLEHRKSVATVLSIQGRDYDRFVNDRKLPLALLVRLSFHRDYAVRNSAIGMISRSLKRLFRIVFYPIVLMTRRLRHGV